MKFRSFEKVCPAVWWSECSQQVWSQCTGRGGGGGGGGGVARSRRAPLVSVWYGALRWRWRRVCRYAPEDELHVSVSAGTFNLSCLCLYFLSPYILFFIFPMAALLRVSETFTHAADLLLFLKVSTVFQFLLHQPFKWGYMIAYFCLGHNWANYAPSFT